MTATEAVIATVSGIVGLLTTGGGFKLFLGWLDRREQARRDHDVAMADRFGQMQKDFLDTNRLLSEELRSERKERLTDTRVFSEALTNLANKLSDALEKLDSRRPPAGE